MGRQAGQRLLTDRGEMVLGFLKRRRGLAIVRASLHTVQLLVSAGKQQSLSDMRAQLEQQPPKWKKNR
jgi:hypothetical protein